MKLYVDDIRIAPDGWEQAWTAAQAFLALESNQVTELSLDHDLGDDNAPTGYDIMCWIEKKMMTNHWSLPSIKFHTANPVGRANMQASLDSIMRRL